MNLLNDTFIKAHGLNARRIRLHQRRIVQALRNEINTDIPIQNPCTVESGSIISWEIATKALQSTHSTKSAEQNEYQKWQKNHVVSCIPAAGAASRFFVECQHFVNYTREQLEHGLELEITSMLVQFPFLDRLIQQVTNTDILNANTILAAYAFSRTLIEKYSSQPKLNVPATNEGDTFLKLKMEEQAHLFPCLGSTLVVPFAMKKQIQDILYQLKPKEYEKWLVLEQDHKLSTIRFLRNGEPYLDDKGQYSIVSAGHGELLHLFDNIADHFTQAHCLHIRNIDNIIGNNVQRKEEINTPIHLFYKLRTALELIRKIIPLIDFNTVNELHDKELMEQLSFISQLTQMDPAVEPRDDNIKPRDDKNKISPTEFYHLFAKLFHWQDLPNNLTHAQIWKLILENSERPLSVFAVVKKEKGDVGGGPIFAKVSDGSIVKLCMEMPHASPEDAKEYFSDRGKTTHFNPALAFFEIKTHTYTAINTGKKVNFVQLFDERFWLLTKREYKGTPVCYHETVLYELIGNSATTNLVFIEVPRSLFKPHKSYLDCLEHNRESYGFNKNFEPG